MFLTVRAGPVEAGSLELKLSLSKGGRDPCTLAVVSKGTQEAGPGSRART